MEITIDGVTFDTEYSFGQDDGRLDEVLVYLKDSEVELSAVLDVKVLKQIDQIIIENQQDEPENEPEEV